jgi:hypothetical protein
MKQRTAATGSERQAKYRRSRKLSAVFLSETTRAAINALQARTGLQKEALVARAIQSLTAELDRQERRRAEPSASRASRRAAGRRGRSEPRDAMSLSDESSPSSSVPTGETPPASNDATTNKAARGQASGGKRGGGPQADQPNLFDDHAPLR